MHIIGTTGKGKSKLLEHMLFQDIASGRGIALIDPHGNLADDVLSYLGNSGFFKNPENINRLVYINPSRLDYSPGINLLELQKGEDPAEHANDIIEVFKRCWDLENAPVFEDVMFNSMMVLMENNLSIIELPRLITDKDYRDILLKKTEDPAVLQFFANRFEKWPKNEQAMRVESTLNKISRLTGSVRIRNIFGQLKSTINFREIMDEGKILIVDLSYLSELSAKLFGGFITTLIQQAAMARRTQKDFFEYLDEFQLFVGSEGGSKTFSRTLAEARKRHLYLVLAHQQLSQLDERMRGALGNVGTLVCFGLDRSDAELQAKRIFLPHGEKIKQEAKTDNQNPVYLPLYEDIEKYIQELDKRKLASRFAYVVSKQRKATLIKTIEVKDQGFNKRTLNSIKTKSSRSFGRSYKEVMKETRERYALKTEPVNIVKEFEKI
ncbi:MAG: AAA-like domain protein [Alphaproteobacteria bacterium ADurb.Bin438]|nr:MAG: AAA-like domain protein [Alphaproteobacteria bacterium ADurb.Bin438]